MKKNLILTIILALVFGLSGCDTGEDIDNTDKKGTIFVYAGAASSLEIAHNSKGFTFPDTYIGESAEVTIVVKNTGSGVIKMTGSPYVNLDGATAVFSVSSALETSTINPGSSASFKIKFSPVNPVESYVYVSIPNNSENTPDFSFTVYGTGLRPKPTASIFYGNNEIPQNGTINAGEARITQSKIISVIIKNTGREVLTVDTENITISGADAAAFTQTTNPGGSVSVGSQTFFNIEYKPVRQGENNAVLTIPTNDTSRNPVIVYLQTIAGAAPKPTASVFFRDNAIPQNGTINVGKVILTHSENIAVVIKNIGEETLTLDTANITITGANAEAFRKTTNPGGSVSVGNQTSFIVSCEPVEQGENNATLIIPTNDNACNPIVVYLRMTAEKGAAVLELKQGNTVIANNSITPFDFGRVALGSNKPLVIMIKNNGNIDLELTGNPVVESSNAAFTIPTQPANKTINPGTEVSFLLQYNPTVEAEENAAITIYNNSDNMVFTLNVKGTGYIKRPQITVKRSNLTINQYGEYSFGTVALGESKDITFDIENTGEANLNIISVNGSRINLEDNIDGLFSVVQQPSTVVTPGNSTNFIVRFSPTTEENNFAATVHIKTDSQDNDEFYFMVKGSGYIKRPQITIKQATAAINPNGEYDFSSVLVSTTKDVIFTIGNTGEANLNFVSVNGNNASLVNNTGNFFTIIQQPLASTVAPGDTTAFTIRFNPTTIGNNYSATVKITTNSQNDNEFSFRVKGNGRSYAIGDTGPGGGLIFFAEGGQYKECSAELGKYPWADAITTAKNYRGGGFTNWHLPDRGELSLMYQNLRGNGLGGFFYDYYWSSEQYSSTYAWYIAFWANSSGRDYTFKTDSLRVRAVRSFGL